jgi:hypothetical protein
VSAAKRTEGHDRTTHAYARGVAARRYPRRVVCATVRPRTRDNRPGGTGARPPRELGGTAAPEIVGLTGSRGQGRSGWNCRNPRPRRGGQIGTGATVRRQLLAQGRAYRRRHVRKRDVVVTCCGWCGERLRCPVRFGQRLRFVPSASGASTFRDFPAQVLRLERRCCCSRLSIAWEPVLVMRNGQDTRPLLPSGNIIGG